MNGNKKVILHIIWDGILFDRVYPRFEEMVTYENRYLFANLNKGQPVKFIKNTEKLILADTIEEWGKIVSDPKVDIIYLHGIWKETIQVIDYVQQNVVVMWWCYGREIYENCNNWPPLLPLKLFKPRTHRFLIQNSTILHALNIELSYSVPKLYKLLISINNFIKGDRVNKLISLLSRIDFAFTPLEIEYCELKKSHKYFHAKYYFLRGSKVTKEPLIVHDNPGNVLFEHSAFVSNNHLDIIAAIKKKNITFERREVFVPLVYGDDKLAERVMKEAKFEGANVHYLKEAIPFDEYKTMMDSCTHAIFGMIRQSGLGNAFLCLQKGIKMYFFKDSIMYKQFKSDGCFVFTIEDDLNNESIKEPLTTEQAKINYDKYYDCYNGVSGTYQEQFDYFLSSK
jgi:hypothetical protein